MIVCTEMLKLEAIFLYLTPEHTCLAFIGGVDISTGSLVTLVVL